MTLADSLPPSVRVRNFERRFGRRTILSGIDLDIRPGEFVALLGPSGCGKSTLLRALAALDPKPRGEVSVPARCSVVFQEPRLLPWKRVWKNVVLGLDVNREAARHLAEGALREVGLAHHADAWPGTLSGGEAQRVALARALVREPALLLLDEPFGALDALTRIKMHALLAQLVRKHRPAVLLVTHDVEEALFLADRAVVLGKRPRASSEHPIDESSSILADLPIDLATRRRSEAAFSELRLELLGHLGVEREEPGQDSLPPSRDSFVAGSRGPSHLAPI